MRKKYDPLVASKTGFELVQADPDTARWTIGASQRAADALKHGDLQAAMKNFLVSVGGFILLFAALKK